MIQGLSKNNPSADGQSSPAFYWSGFTLLILIKLILHLPVLAAYDFHGDELYFIQCGLHLGWGYADHPPLVVWLSRFSFELFGYSITGLRIWPLMAGLSLIGLTMRITQRLDGGRGAQLIAGLCILFTPAYLRMATLMNIPAFEQVVWNIGVLMIIVLVKQNDRRQLIWIGMITGLGLLLKFTFLLFAASFVVVLLIGHREIFRDYRLWLGGFAALVIWSPNLIWQVTHEYAHLQFLSNISRSDGMLGRVPRFLFVVGQFLYFGPYLVPIWISGLRNFFVGRKGLPRSLVAMFIVPFTLLFITNAKPYYLAPAYPLLFASGSILGANLLSKSSAWVQGAVFGTMAISALFFTTITLPWLPLEKMDKMVDKILLGTIPARAITHDYHNQLSWQHYEPELRKIIHKLAIEKQKGLIIWTAYYRQASALRMHKTFLLDVYSTHLNYYFWPPDFDTIQRALVVSIPKEVLTKVFAAVEFKGKIGESVYLVEGPKGGWARAWQTLKHFANSPYRLQDID